MIDFLKSLLTDFDPAAILPDLGELFGHLEMVLRVAVLIGPLCLLGFGLLYLIAPPKEANHILGYRTFWGMSSVEAWQFTQRLAGIVWTVLGLGLTIYMALECNGYRDLGQEAMIYAAMKSLLVELAVIVVSILAINLTILILFDRKGYRRWRNKR